MLKPKVANMKFNRIYLLLFLLNITNSLFSQQRPNIIYILADDLGYGDLSCYGQKKFSTPNIDELSRQGMLFTRHYAGCAVCAPSRSSLMSGQTTGYTAVRGNKSVEPEGQWPITAETFTIAEMLKQVGYSTGCFGKWGLGYPGSDGDPNKQGFDEFYGYNCQSLAHNYYPDHLYHNQEKIVLAGNAGSEFNEYSPYLIQQQAIQFIGDHKNKPFFLFYATTLPHAELLLPEKEISVYRNKFLPEKEFVGLKPGDKNFRQGPYGYQAETHAAFAAMVTLLDKQVGEIMAKVKELGLDKNTIIMFSSDNGPHKEGGGDPDYFDSNGQLKGYKRDLYEGGIREPMLVSWPGRIKSRSTTAHVSAFWDLMPTFAEIAGVTAPENIQGISFLPTLLGRKDQREHADLYWEFHEQGGKQALLKGNWKLIRLNVLDPQKTSVELYDISTDIGEERNLAEKYPEKVKAMLKLMENSRVPNKDFVFIEGK